MAYTAKINHPHDRATEICDDVRDQIVAGRLRPGHQVPSRRALARQYNTSLPSVQKALGRLAEAGFVCARGRLGTRVVEYPPHLFHFALVIREDIHQSRYQRALRNEAQRLTTEGPAWFTVYTDIESHASGPGQERLMADIAAGCLAGCILDAHPESLGANPLLSMAISKVALVHDSKRAAIPAISAERTSWLTKALGWLRERGRRRVSWLGIPNIMPPAVQEFLDQAGKHGFETRPAWTHAVHPLYANWAANAMDAIFGPTAAVRPDALLIADDHLAETATAALAALDLRIPHDLDIVCLNNFPLPLTTHVPVRQLGYDMRKTMRACLHVLARLRADEKVPPKLPLLTAEFAPTQ